VLVGCLCWQLGSGYGHVGDFRTLKLCDVVIGLDVFHLAILFLVPIYVVLYLACVDC
jgi:hypothetical protein